MQILLFSLSFRESQNGLVTREKEVHSLQYAANRAQMTLEVARLNISSKIQGVFSKTWDLCVIQGSESQDASVLSHAASELLVSTTTDTEDRQRLSDLFVVGEVLNDLILFTSLLLRDEFFVQPMNSN